MFQGKQCSIEIHLQFFWCHPFTDVGVNSTHMFYSVHEEAENNAQRTVKQQLSSLCVYESNMLISELQMGCQVFFFSFFPPPNIILRLMSHVCMCAISH